MTQMQKFFNKHISVTILKEIVQYFDNICRAPDGIKHLRKYILDLAVQGKLSEPHPDDKPTPDLLKRFKFPSNEVSIDLPTNWIEIKVGEVLDFKYGKGLAENERLNKGRVSVFGSNGVIGYSSTSLAEESAIIIGRKGSAGALNICLGPSWTTDVAYYVIPPSFFDIYFLFIVLQTLNLNKLGKGVKPGLSRSDAYELNIRIPPLAEQCRIVTKVNGLMALCDRIEMAQIEQESLRDSLTTAALQRLNMSDHISSIASFRENVCFYLQNLSNLTTRTDQIKQLRDIILNFAIRGQLVPQDSKEESASELLQQIQNVKAALIKEKKIKKSSPRSLIDKREVPFKIPPEWEWVRLGDLCSKTGSGSTPRGGKTVYVPSGIPFLRSQNVHNDGLRLEGVAYISDEIHERMNGSEVCAGDLLLNITGGSIGRCAIVPPTFSQGNVNQHVAIIRPVIDSLKFYLHCVILSPYFQDEILKAQTGAGREGLPKNKMDEIIIPLPPIAEQERIIAKVNNLMAICDELGVQISISTKTNSQLLEVLLRLA